MSKIKGFIKREKKLIIAFSLLLVVLVISNIFAFKWLKNTKNKENDTVNLEISEQVKTVNGNMELIALDSTPYGIKTNSSFRLTMDKEASVDDVKKALSVIPERNVTVQSESDTTFLVSVDEPFEKNTIVNIRYESESEYMGWAFQTEKVFNIASTIPTDRSWTVPIDSGIEIYFTKDAPEGIENYFSISPHLEGHFEYYGNRVVFIPDENLLPGTRYTAEISSGYGPIDEIIESTYSWTFSTDYSESRNTFSFLKTTNIIPYDRAQTVRMNANGLSNPDDVTLHIYEIDSPDEYIKGLKYANSRAGSNYQFEDILSNISYKNASTMDSKIITSTDKYGKNQYFVDIPEQLTTGIYLLEVVEPNTNKSAHTFLIATKYQAYAVMDSDQLLIFVIDSITKKPATGCTVEINGTNIGSTNNEGILLANIPNGFDSNTDYYLNITDSANETFVIALTKSYYEYYNDYYYAYFDYYSYGEQTKDYWDFLYTDREVYLPTDTIEVFGFAQNIDKTPLTEVRVALEFYGVKIDEQYVKLSDIGTYKCSFDIENYLDYGVNVVVYDGDNVISKEYVYVSPFEKPTYKVEAELNKDVVIIGDSVEVTAKASFFEGTPFQGNIQLGSDQYYQKIKESPNGPINIECDENGIATTTIHPIPSEGSNYDYPVFFELWVTCNSFAEYYDRTNTGFIFFPRDAFVSHESIGNGNEITINGSISKIDLKNFKGQLYDTDSFLGKGLPNHPVTIEVYENYYKKVFVEQKYDYIKKVTYDVYKYDYVRERIDTINLTTDENGKYSYIFTDAKKDCYYEFIITSYDTQGNKIVKSEYYYDLYRDYYYDYYQVKIDKFGYKVGDTITATISNTSESVGDMTLFIYCKDGILDYVISEDNTATIPFKEEFIPNAIVNGIYYDGWTLNEARSCLITYDYKKTELLNIEFIIDETNYGPGEEVAVKIHVTDLEGNPIKCDVNLSVVDEAYFALYEDDTDPLSELYSYNYSSGLKRDSFFIYSGNESQFGSGAEKGGGDGYAALRSDYKNTAYFDVITTDASGKASTTFTLPDNLTSWRITATALSKDLKAGKATTNVNCTLPFFINDVLFDQYLTGDTVGVTLLTAGTAVTKDMKISYSATLEDPNGNKKDIEADGYGQSYTTIELGQLSAGEYTLTIIAKGNDYSDGIEKTFKVSDTMQYFQVIREDKLKENMEFVTNNNSVWLTFLNEDAARQYLRIAQIAYHDSNRIDLLATSFTAANYLNAVYGSNLDTSMVDNYKNYLNDGIFAESTYSFASPDITAYVLKSDLYRKGIITQDELNAIGSVLQQYIYDPNVSAQSNYAALWGLAIMKYPVLFDTYKAMESEEFTSQDMNIEKVEILLSLIELGDLKNAVSVYDKLMSDFANKDDKEIYFNAIDSRKVTAMMMMAATQMGFLEDADKMYNYLSKEKDVLSPTQTERLIYLMAKEPEHTTCSFDYELNGKKETVKLGYGDAKHLALTAKEAENIEFSNINGNVTVISDFIGTVEDIQVDEKLSIKRTYSVNGVETDHVKQGDVVTVTLEVTFGDIGIVEINDILPAGLVYAHSYNQRVSILSTYANHVDFLAFKQNDNKTITLTYNAIAVTTGSYKPDSVVVKNLWGTGANFDEAQIITIE